MDVIVRCRCYDVVFPLLQRFNCSSRIIFLHLTCTTLNKVILGIHSILCQIITMKNENVFVEVQRGIIVFSLLNNNLIQYIFNLTLFWHKISYAYTDWCWCTTILLEGNLKTSLCPILDNGYQLRSIRWRWLLDEDATMCCAQYCSVIVIVAVTCIWV